VTDPRALAEIFDKAESKLASRKHPDPYICALQQELSPYPLTDSFLVDPSAPGGTKWWVQVVSSDLCLRANCAASICVRSRRTGNGILL